MKIVHIKWADSSTIGGWNNREKWLRWAKTPPEKIDSVGFLAYETKKWIVLLQSVGEYQVTETIQIPRGAIKSMKVIAELPITLKIK